MVTVSSPPPQLSSSSPALGEDNVDVGRMDELLDKLKKNMVDLILQGDDVTRQMWHMYSVFEEIFGHQAAATTTGERPLKQVVVGDKIRKLSLSSAAAKASSTPHQQQHTTGTTTTPPSSSSAAEKTVTSPEHISAAVVPVATASATSTIVSTASNSIVSTNAASAIKSFKTVPPDSRNATPSPQNKVSPGATSPPNVPGSRGSPLSSDRPSDTSSAKSEHTGPPQTQIVLARPSTNNSGSNSNTSSSSPSPAVLTSHNSSSNPTSNPLLDTIGVLATSNADSDDSDLDIVYQQLRYRGRHRRPEQVRIRTHRTTQHRHQHQQVASSDPESIGYAGSNSIDSGYKSLCATPEVSDSLSSAPEVRRSASDVSASDSSTTSGRPRSLDGQDSKSSKIKMGTRSIAGKTRLPERSSPRHTAIDDVTLDHLMYLRQSLRKDAQRSPSDSIPSSVASSAYRDSDLSPRNEDWRDQVRSSYPYSSDRRTSSSSDSTFTGSRASSRGEDIDQEGGGESSSDFLLSGVEYYDLESIQEFPPTTSSYVTMLEEKTRRFQLVSASKCPEPLSERHISSLYRKRSESSQSVDGGMSRSQPQQNLYSMGSSPLRPSRNSKALSRHHRPHHATDSKLTEAAIRVLEMIEDFRMGESMSRSGRMMPYHESSDRHPPQIVPSGSAASSYPSSAIPHDMYMPRYRKHSGHRTGVRPASTGSLMEHEIDARSVASASSYAASAEHHVYEEIMYDLVCERAAASDRSVPPPPIPPDRGRVVRNRLLPVPPQHVSSSHHQQMYAVDPRRIMMRSHKQSSSNLYSMLSNVHGRGNVDRFLEMEWHLSQERRDNLPPDFPV